MLYLERERALTFRRIEHQTNSCVDGRERVSMLSSRIRRRYFLQSVVTLKRRLNRLQSVPREAREVGRSGRCCRSLQRVPLRIARCRRSRNLDSLLPSTSGFQHTEPPRQPCRERPFHTSKQREQ